MGATKTRSHTLRLLKCILYTFALMSPLPALGQAFNNIPYYFADNTTYQPSRLMADYNSIVNQGNVAVATLQNTISSLSPFPKGAIVMFYLQACPSGWTGLNPSGSSDGYYIRGWDAGRGQDPTGTLYGAGEGSTLQYHTHSASGTWVSSEATLPGVACTHACSSSVPVITGMSFSGGQTLTSGSSGFGSTNTPKSVGLLPCFKN